MSNKQIILLDDESFNLEVLSSALECLYEDIGIHLCDNVNDAMLVLQRYKIDAIISDVMMPNVDGFDFASYLVSQPENKNIPIFYVSAIYNSDKVKSKVLNLENVKGFISKPVDLELLKKHLDRYLLD